MLSGNQMRHFVSSQTYALRNFAATRPGPDRFGFAWAPNNATDMSSGTFIAQTGQLLERLGAALSESAAESSLDPGINACASLGFDWCRADVAGASFTDAWRIFSTWQEPSTVRGLNQRLAARVRTLVSRTKSQRRR
jgi:hypothetical protein